ncbi:tRNA (adenosine(37)-N6)-dimethylallyltransferase MiaA [Virgibacillus halophilus]|uniref:tRNA (adenosine(37)-N6)-dimethylallyltransferase MiaA n=1 Tax=Tigheibacillus halophilus TaxID=361280 RepID=UPI00363BE8B2
MKQKVIAIVGPTAVGKTSLSIAVATRFNGEIISGDSMQVYQGMDIGTAKVTKEEQQGIPHYMIDIKKPEETFSVADFQSHVRENIERIVLKDKLPVIAGGSGLYIQAALFDYHFSNIKRNEEWSKKIEKQVKENGIEPLYRKLQEIDPDQAEKIHPNNHRRVIRALEVYETTGMTMSEYQEEQKREALYDIIWIGLEMDRQTLYDRINQRVDHMLEDGLLEEVKGLYDQGLADCQSMQAIGYKEFIPYFQGEINLQTAIELLKRNSRRYAKRQYTWFKNKMDIPWYTVDPTAINKSFDLIFADLAGILQ